MQVLLLSMPWAIFNRPSIQLGTLKGYLDRELEQADITCAHPYLDTATAIGLDTYRRIAERPWAAEALYCGLLFPEQQQKAQRVFSQSMKGSSVPDYQTILQQLDQQGERWLEQLKLDNTDLIGFSVCFSQLPASLYAARAIKKTHPAIRIVFGGSTCTPALGRSLLSLFPELDYIISGEGEQALKELALHVCANAGLTNPAVLSRQQSVEIQEQHCNSQEITDLNTLPLPDYSDYMLQMKAAGLDFIPVLPLEFSRGCWWNKCTFCNLNLQWHGYRSKKSSRMLDELSQMIRQYQCLDFTFTDNALPVKEADLFFAATADGDVDLRFFGEIRTLKKSATYEAYRRGGLNAVQIGIEALSDSLLKRMRKGTTVMDNVAAMKFAQAAGMTLDGNLILEFPGSTKQEVQKTLEVLDKILPFRPLSGAAFFLGHGSPVCCRPEDFGITAITQHPTNRQLYPAPILDKLDMLIKSYRGDRTVQSSLWKPVRKKIKYWQHFHHNRPDPSVLPLSYRDGSTFLIIRQERPAAKTLHHRLHGLSRQIYLACEQPITRKKLLERFSQVTKNQLASFLADLEQKNLLYCSSKSCLALAIRLP